MLNSSKSTMEQKLGHEFNFEIQPVYKFYLKIQMAVILQPTIFLCTCLYK